MLRNAGIRTKLLGLVALPMALLLAVSLVVVLQAHRDAALAGRVADVAEASTAINATVHALQDERAATGVHLAGNSTESAAELARARTVTDQRVRAMSQVLDGLDLAGLSSDVEAAAALAETRQSLLPQLRQGVDADEISGTQALRSYNEAVAAGLSIAQNVVGAAGDEDVARGVRAITLVSTAIESAARERDLLVRNFTRGGIDNVDYRQMAGYITAQETALGDFTRIATGPQREVLNTALVRSGSFALEPSRSSALDLLVGTGTGDPAAADTALDGWIAPLVALETRVVTDAQISAEDVALADRQRELVVLGVAVAGLVVALLLTVLMTRRLVARVRRLTDAATTIGAELPRMVERMRTPGVAPDLAVEPVAVDSGDELGRLAVAFNAVNATTLRVAQEQADLRAGIAEMFVNVARRNQVLLGRQLSFIDKLEQREENPDQLENLFRLDHLATRMRRNAESLLVLAGLDGSRRLRRPMPLSDVVRTAASEIEQYDRVDLTAHVDPSVSGRVALTLAHLVAELLENATHFSNPDTRVVIAGSVEDTGVRLTITDYGLGMTAEEIRAANAVISDPPVAEIAVAQRLGFYVVGRLSQRLDATVVLRRGRASGVIADIVVPASLFEASTLPRAATPELLAGDDSLVVRTDLVAPASDVTGPAVEPAPADAPIDVTPAASVPADEPATAPAVAPAATPQPAPSRPTEARHRARREGFFARRRTPSTPPARSRGTEPVTTADEPDLIASAPPAEPVTVALPETPAPQPPSDVHVPPPDHRQVPTGPVRETPRPDTGAAARPSSTPSPSAGSVSSPPAQKAPANEAPTGTALNGTALNGTALNGTAPTDEAPTDDRLDQRAPAERPAVVQTPEPRPTPVLTPENGANDPDVGPVAPAAGVPAGNPPAVPAMVDGPVAPELPAGEPADRVRPQEFPFVPAVDILPTRPAGRRGRPVASPEPLLPAEFTGDLSPAPSPTPMAVPAPAPAAGAAPAPVPAQTDGNVVLPRPEGFAAAVAALTGPLHAPAPPIPASPAPKAPEDRTSLEDLALGARMTSDAFAELSQLSQGYAPRVETAAAPLVRRQPKAAPSPTPAAAPASPSRARTPDDVRGMLSGFRAGVERGRQGSDTPDPQN